MAQSLLALAFGAAFAWLESALGIKKEVKATGATIFKVEIDNALNANPVYVKGYFAAAAGVTVGTTDPNFIFPAPANAKITYVITGPGGVYPTALTVACVTTPGTAGTLVPTASVPVKVVYT